MSVKTTGLVSRAALGAMVVVAFLLAGCGGDSEEPAGLITESSVPEPTSEDGAETEAAPTDEATPTEHSFPEAGLTVMEPPASSEAEAAALAVYVEFAREWRRTLRDVELSATLEELAVPAIIDQVQDSLDFQEENAISYSGEMVITPTVEESGDNAVVLEGCVDGSALTLIQDGEERPVDGVDEHPVIPMRVVLGNDGSGWKVNENTFYEDESC